MKWKSIVKTAICNWSEEDECYVVSSSLFPRIIGTGQSAKIAWAMFRNMLDDAFDDLRQDRVAGYKRGRPAKGGVNIHLQCRPETRDFVNDLAQELEISQGDILDFLSHFYQCYKQLMPTEAGEQVLPHVEPKRNFPASQKARSHQDNIEIDYIQAATQRRSLLPALVMEQPDSRTQSQSGSSKKDTKKSRLATKKSRPSKKRLSQAKPTSPRTTRS